MFVIVLYFGFHYYFKIALLFIYIGRVFWIKQNQIPLQLVDKIFELSFSHHKNTSFIWFYLNQNIRPKYINKLRDKFFKNKINMTYKNNFKFWLF